MFRIIFSITLWSTIFLLGNSSQVLAQNGDIKYFNRVTTIKSWGEVGACDLIIKKSYQATRADYYSPYNTQPSWSILFSSRTNKDVFSSDGTRIRNWTHLPQTFTVKMSSGQKVLGCELEIDARGLENCRELRIEDDENYVLCKPEGKVRNTSTTSGTIPDPMLQNISNPASPSGNAVGDSI